MSEREPGFVFDAELCVQCHACETACKTWRGLEKNVRWRRVAGGFTGTYPAVKLLSVSLACQHCAQPACETACPVNAIAKGADGAVRVDGALCVGCRACLKACPFDAPQFGADRKMQKCDLCGLSPDVPPPCAQACPTRALSLRCLTLAEKRRGEEALLALYQKAGR